MKNRPARLWQTGFPKYIHELLYPTVYHWKKENVYE